MSEHWKTIPQMVLEKAQRHSERIVLRVKREGRYEEITWCRLMEQVKWIALGLMDLSVGSGDRVAILSENRPEWAAADLAILSLGAVTVPIYPTLTSEEIEYILRDSQSKVLFVCDPEAMAKVVSYQEALNLKCVLFDAPYRVSGPRVWWIGEVMGLGLTADPSRRKTWEEGVAAGKSEKLASILYTSGTTGPPKGVMLTHGNFLSNCFGIRKVFPIAEGDSTLSFLPLSHVFERTAGYYVVLMAGGTLSYAESLETVPTQLIEVRPTILTGVPRFYEKMHDRIQEAVNHASPLKRWIFHWALRVGKRRAGRLLQGQAVPPWLSLEYRIADRLAFAKLRARLGGRLRLSVSGSAPLAKELAEFFYAAGILILEGYGLTETSPVITVNRPDRFRFGTVGLPIPGVAVRLAEDGEILTRGPHVMQGYFRNPEATAEVLDAQGWFHTGDIGVLDPDGFLTITDRKKDIIKTSGGKMVAPQNLENALRRDPFIADCVVVGDKHRYLTVLIVPNRQKLEGYARGKHLVAASFEELLKAPEVVRLFEERVQALNEKLASFEQLKKFTLLPEPFTLSEGILTPTLKVKRRVVAQRFAQEIEAMY